MEDLLSEHNEQGSEVTDPPEPENDIRNELLALSETGKIRYTTKYIKKANQDTLEKIKKDYYRKQLDATNKTITNDLISKFTELLNNLDMIENPSDMKKDLDNNELFKDNLNSLVSQVTPYIPYIGLFSGGITIGKHIITNYTNKANGQPEQQYEQYDS